MAQQNRRAFIKQTLLMLAVTPLVRLLSAGAAGGDRKPIAPPAGQTPVAESDSVASALGYHADIKDIDYKRFPHRSQPNAKNQDCHSCANYTAANQDWGKCLILGGLVSSRGWCGSWDKKSG